MTTLLAIKESIGRILEQNGYTVYASEVAEGFNTPCCFVVLTAFETTATSEYILNVNATFDVLYVPQIKTHEHLIITADELQKLFINLPLPVGDRFFYIENINGEIENNNIRLSLNFNYTDLPENVKDDTAEPVENINFKLERN